MERINCSSLKKHIAKIQIDIPLILQYIESKEPYPKSNEVLLDYLNEPLLRKGKWDKMQRKFQFIYTVIFEGIYYLYEGKELKVSDEEIQMIFNKYVRTVEIIDTFAHLQEFSIYLYRKAKEVLEIEKQELEAYNNKSFLRKLLDNESMLSLHFKAINQTSRSLVIVENNIQQLFNDLKRRIITGAELDAPRETLERSKEYYRDRLDYLLIKYKQTSENTLYRTRKYLRCSFDHKELHSIEHVANPTISPRNLSTATFVLEEYCRWYNDRFTHEIEKAKKITLNVAKQEKRQQLKLSSKQYIQKQERIQLIEPLLEENISIREIAKRTGLSNSTVQRIVAELKYIN